MPRYRFDGFHETVLMGLSHAVNGVEVHRLAPGDDGEIVPVDFASLAESTVVALPGDEITTSEPYANAWMTNLDTGRSDVDGPDPEPAKPKRRRRGPNQTDPSDTDPTTAQGEE